MFIEKGGSKELLMEDVVHVIKERKAIKVIGILGDKKEINGKIKEINLMKHTIVIEEA